MHGGGVIVPGRIRATPRAYTPRGKVDLAADTDGTEGVDADRSVATQSGDDCVVSAGPGHRRSPADLRYGSAAVASPTTLSSPSPLDSVTAMSISFWPSSSRLPVTTIFVVSSSSGQVWRANRT